MEQTITFAAAALGALAVALPRLRRRLQLSRAKHRSLAGHSRIAKRLAAWLPGYAYDEARFFASDGAPPDIVAHRRAGFAALVALYDERFPRSIAMTRLARETLSDLQFTGRYRVPFQYSPYLRERLAVGAFVQASEGPQVIDLDGNRLYDLTGSYTVVWWLAVALGVFAALINLPVRETAIRRDAVAQVA